MEVSMQQSSAPKTASRVSWRYYAIAFTVALLALLPRTGFVQFDPARYLWAEDGPVFLNEAEALGLGAIFHPYAGYLHFYPRIITALSQLVTLPNRPMVLTLGWILAYLVMMSAVVRVAARSNRSIMSLVMVVGLVSLQPNWGEVFFNVTNSQWMIGATLFIFALVEAEGSERRKQIKGLALAPMALTGPFSVILAPILLLRIWLKKDWQSQKYIYLPIFFGAIVQTCVLLTHQRVSSGVTNTDLSLWWDVFTKLVLFEPDSFSLFVVALAIWGLLGYMAYTHQRGQAFRERITHPAALMLIAAFLLIVGGIFANKHDPAGIVALGGGGRYTWVPYALIVVAGFMLSQGRKVLGSLVTLLFTLICIAEFHTWVLPNLQFEAFVHFSQKEQVFMPIHPVWEEYPSWHILAKPSGKNAHPGKVIELDLKQVSATGLSISYADQDLVIKRNGLRAMLTFTQKLSCPNNKFAGVNIYLTREEDEGVLQLFWDEHGNFKKADSLARWYPEGEVKAQYAFPMPPSGVLLGIEPYEMSGQTTIRRVEVHCV